MNRIDTHHHLIPPFYRDALRDHGIADAGGRALPDWSPETSLATMSDLAISTAMVSVSTPGTSFLSDAGEAAELATRLNHYGADLVAQRPDRFGYFATLPTPHVEQSVAEATRALDHGVDGVVLLANSAGTYLGAPGLDELWQVLDERGAVVFIHPAELPAAPVDGIPPFAADFLLDTTRASYLLVRNGIVRDNPNIRFILSHGGGFVPYAAHRMATAIAGDTKRSILDVLDDFRSFYFDTALSSSFAALPTLLAFAEPGHITFGSDWPFAPTVAGAYFAAGLEDYTAMSDADRRLIERGAAEQLFPRLATSPPPSPHGSTVDRLTSDTRRTVMRIITRALQP
ncbi:amidohydrolase family protein [Williamsia sterculiae]|uniref:Predicted metal-dependent hydrolase, TIM-barrel fold n=1 Tax=Williamsia sterculiae TaxID=1344003 RepID=A0A1N7CMR8_9NOCA|nr:amidohydrolase family protein [Williamsia sterculiae]SIR64902.1 Predicted metal-dependent hydrolase, TIM-barrel fold [Williamsia sterculiae]